MLGQGSRLIWHPGWGSLICYLDSTANLEGQCPEEPVASLPTILSNPTIPVGRGGTCWDSRSALLKVPTVAHREWVPALVSRSDMTWHSGQLYLCGNLDSMPAGVLHNTCNCPWALHCSDLGTERERCGALEWEVPVMGEKDLAKYRIHPSGLDLPGPVVDHCHCLHPWCWRSKDAHNKPLQSSSV